MSIRINKIVERIKWSETFQLFFLLFFIPKLIYILSSRKYFFFFPSYHTGGAEKVHLDIIKSLDRNKVFVVFTDKSHNTHFLKEFKKHSYAFDYTNFKKKRFFDFLIIKIIKVINTKDVFFFGCNSTKFYNILKFLPEKVSKIDLIHAFSFPDIGMENLSIPMVPLLTKRIVINKKTKDDFIQLYNKNNIADKYIDRIQIINTAIEVPQILTKKKLPKEKLNINYFGRIAPEKRLHLFVKIAERAFNIGNFKIYGPKQENYQFIEPYYEKNITDNKCMTIVYNKTDILLITSYREGLPVVIQEAMAHGVVCISTDVGSISEHITNGINGFVVNNEMPENLIIDSFVQIINNLYSDQDYLHYLSVQSHKYAFDNFNMKIFNHEIKHLFSNE